MSVHMHLVKCPHCQHKFYVKLPGSNVKNDHMCVECDEVFSIEYEFTVTKDGTELMETEVEEDG